jgi:hypothetical protein
MTLETRGLQLETLEGRPSVTQLLGPLRQAAAFL